MRMSWLFLTMVLVVGCENISVELVFPPTPDNGSDSDDGDGDGTNEEVVLVCVVNASGVAITYRISVLGLEPLAASLDAGATECFNAPCGQGIGIDQILSDSFDNPGGAQFLAEQIPCSRTVELRIQSDGSVASFISTEAST